MTDFEPLDPDDATAGDRTLDIAGTVVDPDSLDWRPVRKRPVQVHAVQIDQPFMVETLEGTMEAAPGDVLIRGVEGEFYPCDADIFRQSYMAGDAGDGDHDRLTRASVLLDDATAPLDASEPDRKAVQALLELADYVGADVRFPDANPGGEADDGGGN